ncbi:MAG: hypothetical protein ACRDRZ_01770 [Pseudonocardiaceae bacterium]
MQHRRVLSRFYARPEGAPIQLRVQPRLASWELAGHPDQLRLADALADTERLLTPVVAQLVEPLALRLDVGLHSAVPLLEQHDLDNYLDPLARHLAKRMAKRFVSVWGTKQHTNRSFVRVESARPVTEPEHVDYRCDVRTTASGSSNAFKQQIQDRLVNARELREGAVALQLSFAVGPRRNWLNLWKQTIDALDLLLGRTRPGQDWHPRDGRIVDLGLHCAVDSTLANDVIIGIRASASG